jgi:hypothetical protein
MTITVSRKQRNSARLSISRALKKLMLISTKMPVNNAPSSVLLKDWSGNWPITACSATNTKKTAIPTAPTEQGICRMRDGCLMAA